MRHDAADQRAEEKDQQQHDGPARPFADARLGERAAEPRVHDVGKVPREPEADEPGRKRNGLADEAAEEPHRARHEQDDGEQVVGAVHWVPAKGAAF